MKAHYLAVDIELFLIDLIIWKTEEGIAYTRKSADTKDYLETHGGKRHKYNLELFRCVLLLLKQKNVLQIIGPRLSINFF